MYKKYPILEYDTETQTIIDAKYNVDLSLKIPTLCVISFFGDAIQRKITSENCRKIGTLLMETFELPLYECVSSNGQKVALLHGLGGGPYAAGQIEKMHALGCRNFMVCGGCGVLEKGSTVGEIFIPRIALRDEGTSYHYIPAERTIEMNESVYEVITQFLSKLNIPYESVKTWTTDAMYRETVEMVKRRREEGCQVVEMECASFFAVAQYKNDRLGQLLYAGDDLSEKEWNSRNWKDKTKVRDILLDLTIEICSIL